MSDFLTFANIQDEIKRAVKGQKGSKNDLIKAMINMVYLNEILAVDDLYPLFWLVKFDDSLVSKVPATITGITVANPPIVTAAGNTLTAGDIISCHDVVGMTEVNNRLFLVDDADNDFELQDLDGSDIDGSGFTAYTSGGTVHHRGVTLSLSIQSVLQAQWLDEQPMDVITKEELMKYNKYWDDSIAMPTKYMHTKQFTAAGVETNRMLWFLAADTAYRLQYWYLLRCARLVADADVPLLPPQFHHAIVAGVITRLIESNVQVENQIVWPSIYSAHLNSIKAFNRKYYKDNDVSFRDLPFMV